MRHELPAAEAAFFAARLAAINRTLEQMAGAVALYCETRELGAGWTLAPGGAALERVEVAQGGGG